MADMKRFKTDYKDEVPKDGKRLYNAVDDKTNAIINKDIRLVRSNTNIQEGDTFGAMELNDIGKHLNGVSNENLLINGDFQVWQSGTTFKPNLAGQYTADEWHTIQGTGLLADISKIENGLRFVNKTTQGAGISQYREMTADCVGNNYTLTVQINGKITSFTSTLKTSKSEFVSPDFNLAFLYDTVRKVVTVDIWFKTVKSFDISYIKFEHSEFATPNVPRPYAKELALCERYYYSIKKQFSTFANVTSYGGSLVFLIHKCFRIAPTVTVNGSLMVFALDKNANVEYVNPMITCSIDGVCTKVGTSIPSGEDGLIQTNVNSTIEWDARIR